MSAARQDALELKQLEEQLRKEADNKITEAAAMADQKIREAQKQLSIATQRQKNAAQRLQEAQAIEISYEARETVLKAQVNKMSWSVNRLYLGNWHLLKMYIASCESVQMQQEGLYQRSLTMAI